MIESNVYMVGVSVSIRCHVRAILAGHELLSVFQYIADVLEEFCHNGRQRNVQTLMVKLSAKLATVVTWRFVHEFCSFL